VCRRPKGQGCAKHRGSPRAYKLIHCLEQMVYLQLLSLFNLEGNSSPRKLPEDTIWNPLVCHGTHPAQSKPVDHTHPTSCLLLLAVLAEFPSPSWATQQSYVWIRRLLHTCLVMTIGFGKQRRVCLTHRECGASTIPACLK